MDTGGTWAKGGSETNVADCRFFVLTNLYLTSYTGSAL